MVIPTKKFGRPPAAARPPGLRSPRRGAGHFTGYPAGWCDARRGAPCAVAELLLAEWGRSRPAGTRSHVDVLISHSPVIFSPSTPPVREGKQGGQHGFNYENNLKCVLTFCFLAPTPPLSGGRLVASSGAPASAQKSGGTGVWAARRCRCVRTHDARAERREHRCHTCSCPCLARMHRHRDTGSLEHTSHPCMLQDHGPPGPFGGGAPRRSGAHGTLPHSGSPSEAHGRREATEA